MTRGGRAATPVRVAATAVALLVSAAGAGGARAGASSSAHDVRAAGQRVAQLASSVQATWCGAPSPTDRVPNVVAGHPVHWVYAVPTDGADALATYGSTMQTDVEAIDAWWRGQDPTRAPRNDLAQFACGAQLDITTVRLPHSAQQLSGGGRFNALTSGLLAAGLSSSFTKHVVYYDGPVTDDEICGQGGSDRSGFGVAVVYVRACPGVSTAVVAAHELLHTLGAVSSAAPSACTGETENHVCDDERDLMYPLVDESPLEARLLDVGRDDYYGHSGSWTDARRAPWLVQVDGQVPFALTVSGPGSVRSDVPGLECARSCTTIWNSGTALGLTAVPRPGAKLVRWSGACTGTGACSATLPVQGTVSALFAPAAYRLSVAISGRGRVRSARPGIACPPRCAASFSSHVPLRLTARAAARWRFRAWTGACRGSRPACTVPMTAVSAARAAFVRARP